MPADNKRKQQKESKKAKSTTSSSGAFDFCVGETSEKVGSGFLYAKREWPISHPTQQTQNKTGGHFLGKSIYCFLLQYSFKSINRKEQ